jgi:endonuclease/exonuclease/phosphatase family metal-dependent hydrolase
VIPECPVLPKAAGATFWTGVNRHKGLGVLVRPPWRIVRRARAADLPRYLQPLHIDGPEPFVLWAVWACHVGVDRYVRGVHRALDDFARLLAKYPTVMLGDFNSNTFWDAEHPEDRSHSALVRRLADAGLVSAYHHHRGEAQGKETVPTFFEYRHAHRPYHIDYCFLPAAWAPRMRRVTVGAHAEWAGLSDHMPLCVELDAT